MIHPDALIFEEAEVGVFHHAESLRKALIERIDKTIDTNRGPVMLMGVVVGDERSVAYIACDHLVTDGFSCVIKAHELSVMYESTISGEHVELPEVDSYLDYGSQEYAEVEKVQTDDPRVELWRGFVQRNGHVFTEFPVELNTTKGAWHPAMVDVIQVLDASEADGFMPVGTLGGHVPRGVTSSTASAGAPMPWETPCWVLHRPSS
ncbi:MAG: condensation domain-containing protein [Actinomycetota bacterium]|nr:condensation domain-containing protein [Actinomycetota bacterium]